VLRVGHRGAPVLAPANTIESFAAAVEQGVDLIEFDVVPLDDGTLVVAHDRVKGAKPAWMPTLDEALAWFCDEGRVDLHLDLKVLGTERAAVEALRARGLLGRTLVSSFSAASLRAVRALEPALTLSLTYPTDRTGLSSRRSLAPAISVGLAALRRVLARRIDGLLEAAQADAATLAWVVISPEVVARCHARGAPVLAWTVDDAAVAARLEAAGVDGIITNDPRILSFLSK
jgi:glycerophosphoryl diester phosphodiesterase